MSVLHGDPSNPTRRTHKKLTVECFFFEIQAHFVSVLVRIVANVLCKNVSLKNFAWWSVFFIAGWYRRSGLSLSLANKPFKWYYEEREVIPDNSRMAHRSCSVR
jgi:hypothetical protein